MKRVLIVDDNTTLITVIRTAFRRMDIEFLDAINGKEGVNKAEQYEPNLIVMDYKMPIMNGWEATKAIRAIPKLSSTVIIGHTAFATEDILQEGLDAGCSEIIKKPIDIDILRSKLEEYL